MPMALSLSATSAPLAGSSGGRVTRKGYRPLNRSSRQPRLELGSSRRTMCRVAAATVNWTQAEIEEVLDAVSASSIGRGRKKALEELNRAQAKIAANENPKARMTIRFGERPAALIAEVLQGRSSPAARSAMRLLEEAAIQAVHGLVARSAMRST